MVEEQKHYYECEIEWQGEKHGELRAAQTPPIVTGAPPEFKGRAGDWSPEALLVGSLNSCYMLTFLAICEFSKIGVISFSSAAKGTLEKVGGNFQITEILVQPHVVIAAASDLPRMPRILEKAKENCFISNSIKSVIKIEPEVFHHQTPAAPCPLGEGPVT